MFAGRESNARNFIRFHDFVYFFFRQTAEAQWRKNKELSALFANPHPLRMILSRLIVECYYRGHTSC